LNLVRTLVRWVVALAGVLTIGCYAVVGYMANMQPSVERFDGWIALLQPADDLSAGQIQIALSGRVASSSAADGPPSVSVMVRACGGAFNGVLLLGGDARMDAPHVMDEQGSDTRAWENIDLALRQQEQVWDFGQVQRIPVSIGNLDCVPETAGAQVGRAVEVVGQVVSPLKNAPSLLGGTAPRSSVVWPLMGGLPRVNIGNKGAFSAVRGLEGEWAIPLALTNEVNLGALTGGELVEGAIPPLADSSKLRWSSTSPLHPTVRLADTIAVAELQRWLVPLGILLGITGSVLASMLFEWAKRPALPAPPVCHAVRAAPPNADMPPVLLRSSEPRASCHVGIKAHGTGAAVVLAGLIGYFIGGRR
jgi:hypothetical protein